jgi:general secretion pathway protein A
MYTSYFGIKRAPFNLTADPSFLYLTNDHREALAGLVYAVHSRKGFVVLASEAGMGKTTLLHAALHRFQSERICSSIILNPTLTPNEFIELTLLDFGVAEVPSSKAQRLHLLHQLLLEKHREGAIPVLFVDEAHKLAPEVLEEIRLLSNFEKSDEKLLQIVLAGQTQLSDLLNRPDLWQLKQRIALRMSIQPLCLPEIERYIQHRWCKAGGSLPTPFQQDAIDCIAQYSKGIPRVINVICDNALTQAFADSTRQVGAKYVLMACADLQLNANGDGPRPVVKAAPVPIPEIPVPAPVPAPAQVSVESPHGILRTLERYPAARKAPSRWTRWFRKPLVTEPGTGNL